MKLSALNDFHRVAQAGSLGRASRESGRPKATLSRQIRQLENSLGLRLLERGQKGLRLTQAGQSLYDETYSSLRDIDDAVRRLAAGQTQMQGTLRVSAPVLFSETVGARLAVDYIEQFPGMRLDWVTTDHQVDLVEAGIDVVIRINPQPESELVGRCFAHDVMLVVAAPSVVLPAAGSGSPIHVPAVTMGTGQGISTWEVTHQDGVDYLVPNYRLRLSSFNMVHAATCAGIGAALLPRSLVQSDVDSGRLCVWGTYAGRSVEVWVLHSSRRLVSPKVTAFVDFVVDSFPTKQL